MQDEINKNLIKAQNSMVSGGKRVGNWAIGKTKKYMEMGYRKSPLIFILIMIIIGIIVLYLISSAIYGVVGYFQTPAGIVTLLLLVTAIGLYFYLRYIGVYLNGWLGAIIEISLLMLFLIIFMGVSDWLMSASIVITPILVIGAILYFVYRVISQISNPTVKVFAVLIGVLFVVSIFVINAVILPYTVGEQKIIEIDISHTNRIENIVLHERIYSPYATMSLTTSMNPYIIEVAQLSRNMWKFGDIHEYIIDWSLTDVANGYIKIAESYNNHVYIVGDESTALYSVVYLKRYIGTYYNFMLVVKVYDSNYHLIKEETYHLYGVEQ